MLPSSSATHSATLHYSASLNDSPDTLLAPYLTFSQRAALRSGSDKEIAYADE